MEIGVLLIFVFTIFSYEPVQSTLNVTCLLSSYIGRQKSGVGGVKKWFYNYTAAQCQEYTYFPSPNGTRPNSDNFPTKESCLETCGNNESFCEYGETIKNKKGRELYCGLGLRPEVDECPANTYCKLHKADIYAVCCHYCPSGDVVLNETNGRPLKCNETKGQLCPQESYCLNRGFDSSICCTNKTTPITPKCPHGKPLIDKIGNQTSCGPDPNHPFCPKGYMCVIPANDDFQMCCPSLQSKK